MHLQTLYQKALMERRFALSRSNHSVIRSLQYLALVLYMAAAVKTANAQPADTIPRALQKKIPSIIRYLNDHSFKTVGVLKFRVKKGSEKLSDSVGPLNSLIADRLEIGLILGNSFNDEEQLNVIKDASSQVANNGSASHLTEEGRNAFFQSNYELAWGDQTATADAFLTGIVRVNPDSKSVTVGVLCFNRHGGGLEKACDVFQAKLDAASLSELGESFVLRGAFDGGTTKSKNTTLTAPKEDSPSQQEKEENVLEHASAVKSSLTSFPLNSTTAPVKLEITYDGKSVPIETRDGKGFIREPQEGEKVEIAIIRTTKTDSRIGVVLKVNGENTLYRQTLSDLECAKWILSKQHIRTVVRGYQIAGTDEMESFAVLSQSESEKRSVNYGRSLGQIQVTVFQEENLELAADLPPAIPDEDEEDLTAMLRGIQPSKTPKSLSALKHQLRLAGKEGGETRGLIVNSKITNNDIQIVEFTPDPTPVMSATLTYFKKSEAH